MHKAHVRKPVGDCKWGQGNKAKKERAPGQCPAQEHRSRAIKRGERRYRFLAAEPDGQRQTKRHNFIVSMNNDNIFRRDRSGGVALFQHQAGLVVDQRDPFVRVEAGNEQAGEHGIRKWKLETIGNGNGTYAD
jgi:hypothetical protein